jgi:undecaprenyl-diphosphatase
LLFPATTPSPSDPDLALMTPLQALVLGIIQGLAEFLPISSSAHLVLAPWLFGWEDPGLAFDVALHVGTLFALLWYFRAEWLRLLSAAVVVCRTFSLQGPEERRLAYIVVGTIPGGIAGILFEQKADVAFRAPALVASALILLGILLWLADAACPARRSLDGIRWRDALLIGVAQAFAIVPGVSRSGSTITAGRALGLDRESAAVFSFLLSMPIIAGAAIHELPRLSHGTASTTALLIGVAAAAVSGWFAIAVLLRFVKQHSYGVFAVYRVLVGAAVLVIVALRARHG